MYSATDGFTSLPKVFLFATASRMALDDTFRLHAIQQTDRRTLKHKVSYRSLF
jgi:hypothetical protein